MIIINNITEVILRTEVMNTMNKTENENCINYNSKDGITLGQLMSIIMINSVEDLEVSYDDLNGESCSESNSCFIRDNNIYLYNEDEKETYKGKDFVNDEMPKELADLKLMIRNEDISRIYDDFRIVTDVTIFKNKKTNKLSAISLSNND